MSRLLAVILNLIVPGTGLIQLGRWKLACITQLALLMLTVILCWSRWIFEPVAIQIFFGLVVVIYLFSTGLCLRLLIPSPLKPGRLLLLSFVFMLTYLTGFATGFVFKQHLVKRINLWPNGELTKNNLWYVVGDNCDASQDSRYFGGITTGRLIGEVKLILVAFNKSQQLHIDSLLTPVR